MEPQRLDIAFVSDVACPWCAIGLASLDQALARLPGDVQATVRPEPFELNPNMGAEGAEVVPYLAKKYGRTPEQVAQTQAMIRERGAAVGFSFTTRKHVWNTFDAHRMLHWAGLEGRAVELKRALLRAEGLVVSRDRVRNYRDRAAFPRAPRRTNSRPDPFKQT